MQIELHLYASLAAYLPRSAVSKTARVPLPDGAQVHDLMITLGIPEKAVKLIFVNGMHAPPTATLQNGDRVGLFPPVGGG